MSKMYRNTAFDIAKRVIEEGYYRPSTLWLISRERVEGYHLMVFPCKKIPKKMPGIYERALTAARGRDRFCFFMEAIDTYDVSKLAEEIEYKRNSVTYSRFVQKPLPDIRERII